MAERTQAKATDAIKAKWAAEREAFLAGGAVGGASSSPSYEQAPAPAPAPMPLPEPARDRPMTAKERREQQHLEMLKQVQALKFMVVE